MLLQAFTNSDFYYKIAILMKKTSMGTQLNNEISLNFTGSHLAIFPIFLNTIQEGYRRKSKSHQIVLLPYIGGGGELLLGNIRQLSCTGDQAVMGSIPGSFSSA